MNTRTEDFNIDSIYKLQKARVDKQIEIVMPTLKKKGASVLKTDLPTPLTTLVHERYRQMAKELAWIEQKSSIYENPAEKRREELKKICILNDINNPIIGEELYDPMKPDTTHLF